jgi:hypothetical protein
MTNIVKVCLRHGNLKEDQVHRENNKSKKGYLLRCNQCKLEKDRRWKDLNREQHNASAGLARKESRRLYREGMTDIEPKANVWIRSDMKKDREKYRIYEKNYINKLGIENYRRLEVLRLHGISKDRHDGMIQEQKNLCAVCENVETRSGRTKGTITPLCIDHCHICREQGKDDIRGLLCHSCNTGIGKFKDNIDLLKKAILYLEKHQCN